MRPLLATDTRSIFACIDFPYPGAPEGAVLSNPPLGPGTHWDITLALLPTLYTQKNYRVVQQDAYPRHQLRT